MESYYNFYYDNEERIKKYSKYLGYGTIGFFGGFVIFYLFNFKKNSTKQISANIPEMKVEELRKFLRKLINNLLLKYAYSFDRLNIVRYDLPDLDSDELNTLSLSSFIGDNIEIESQQVDEVKKSTDSVVINAETHSAEGSFMKQGSKSLESQMIWKEINESIIYEVRLFQKYRIDRDTYESSIKKHFNDSQINSHIHLLRDYIKSFMNLEVHQIDFPEVIQKKYFLIITNIYYLCVKTCCVFFKKTHLDNTNINDFDESKLNLFSEIYKKKLKDVRKQVLAAFEVQSSYNNLDVKLLLRMLPFYYDINSNFRKKTIFIKKIVDEILNYLENKTGKNINENIFVKIERIVNLHDNIVTDHEIDLKELIPAELVVDVQNRFKEDVEKNSKIARNVMNKELKSKKYQ